MDRLLSEQVWQRQRKHLHGPSEWRYATLCALRAWYHNRPSSLGLMTERIRMLRQV